MPTFAKEIANLVELLLSPPTMGHAGGSATEERALDAHRAKARAELARLRSNSTPALDPEAHTILDACARIIR